MTKEFEYLYDTILIRPGNSVWNTEIRDYIKTLDIYNWFSTSYDMDCQEEYLNYYPKWIESSKLNSIKGLNSFPHKYISLGVTQSIDEFHFEMLQQNRKIRVFRGEYPYSRDNINFDWAQGFINDYPLQKNDAIIISLPFSATGDIHPQWNWLLNECEKLDIPIFVDCAFFGTCGGIKVNFNHPAIKVVSFSLTKGVSAGDFRSGIKFSKSLEGKIARLTEWHHGIHLNTLIGLELMKKFNPDHHYNKFRKIQEMVCQKYNLVPSPCIHVATGGKGWEYFSRDGFVNRIVLRNAIKQEIHEMKKNGRFF